LSAQVHAPQIPLQNRALVIYVTDVRSFGGNCVDCEVSTSRGVSVKVHRLFGGSFDPAAIKVMGEAFELAWEQIASHFDGNQMIRDSARQSLADAVLAAAADSIPDVQALKDASLRLMASKNNSLRHTTRTLPM
jgi:hypothetical protein